MTDSLAKYGIFIDDLSKIRVLEPDVFNQTIKLKDECQNFVTSKYCVKKSITKFYCFCYYKSRAFKTLRIVVFCIFAFNFESQFQGWDLIQGWKRF